MTGPVRVTGAVPGRQSAVSIKCVANKKYIGIQIQKDKIINDLNHTYVIRP